MFFAEKKLGQRIEELRQYVYRDKIPMEHLCGTEDTSREVAPALPADRKGWKEYRIGDLWEGRDKYLWLSASVKVPAAFAAHSIVGLFDFGKTGGGGNSGFESLLYVNGKPYQGVDSNHKEVFFDKACAGKDLHLLFRLWSGLEGGGVPKVQRHELTEASLAWLDEKADDLYYTGAMVLGTVNALAESDPKRHMLLVALNDAFNRIDWSYPGDENFYASVYEADYALSKSIEEMDKDSKVLVSCIGHTHIDMAWLWRLKHTREKGARSFSTVLRLMEKYPEYTFLQTQPQLYEYIKHDYPDIYAQIKQRVKEGRWEIDGAMWVEADCNLTSGESLTRQILIGKKFAKEEFGKDMTYLWLPDVFGYSWALPQILKKSGIDMFMTTKISWNQFNRMPHDTFYWKGMDGSEVLTHFITTPEPGERDHNSFFYTYNGQILPETVKGLWEGYSEKDTNRELLISYGYGDGGGGVNRAQLEQRRRIDKIDGCPYVETSRAGDYFTRLKKTFSETKNYVHTWDGELYLEYHRGTYTSHAYNKRMNRKLELYYREAEWLNASARVSDADYNQEQDTLTEGWKIILRNQFHDIIPGSAIREVYEDSKAEYADAKRIAQDVEDAAYARILEAAEEGVYTVVNNSGFARTDLIEMPLAARYTDKAGRELNIQETEKGCLVEAASLQPMSLSTIVAKGAGQAPEKSASAFSYTGETLETPYYKIRFNDKGQITSLFDKENDKEVIAAGQAANVLLAFEDKPMNYDDWDIDIYYQEKCRVIDNLTDTKVAGDGALAFDLKRTYRYMQTTIVSDMVVYAHDRRIDFKTYVDFHERHQVFKVAFPVAVRSTYATYDIQYGNVRRPNNWNTSWDQARFECVGHRFADLSAFDYGVSLMNDCKYGYDIKNNVMRLTLLKAGTYPDYEQDQGEHQFTYSLLPHTADFVRGGTVPSAFALNQPLRAVVGRAKEEGASFVSFDSPYVELDAVKVSEDKGSVIVRFHEYAGGTERVTVRPGFAYKHCTLCNLMEETEGDAPDDLTLTVKPYEIVTLAFAL